MSIDNPFDLVDEFHESGFFDNARSVLAREFQQSSAFLEYIDIIRDVGKQRFETDQKLRFLSRNALLEELMQEIDRFPIIESAASGFQTLSDADFVANVHNSIREILVGNKGSKTCESPSRNSFQGSISLE